MPPKPASDAPSPAEEPAFLFEDTIRSRVIITSDKDTLLEMTEQINDSVQTIDTIDLNNFKSKVSMEVLAARLAKIQGQMPLTLNRKVAGFIDFFTVRKRNYTQTMLERQDYYFPLFEKYLAKYGLPPELKYLSIVESGLNHAAISRTGAVGLWQFMGPTARDHTLAIDYYCDERMDPEKSTDAACRYLRTLYRVFGDWELVLASYNCGLGRIRSVMRRTGKKHFWDMYESLPQETRAYVPQFVAVVYAMNYATEHNIYPDADSTLFALEYDTVTVNEYIHLPGLAKHLGVPYDHLKRLNPVLRRNATPHNRGYVLCLPAQVRDFFADNKEVLMDSVGMCSAAAEAEMRTVTFRRNRQPDLQLVYHRVRRGENLFRIAEKYGTTAQTLRKLNQIAGNAVRPGRRIIVRKGGQAPVMDEVAPQLTLLRTPKVAKGHKARKYTVQPGDTLWAITQKHEGLTVEELIRMNKLKGRKIVAGQKLIVG